MKIKTLCLLTAVSVCVLTTAQAQLAKTEHGIPNAPTKLSNTSTVSTGTILKRHLRWKSKIPLSKTYAELTPEQKSEFRAMYESLPESDEPPFPEQGIKPVFNQLQRAQDVLQARGELNLAVTIDPDGNAIKVDDFGGVKGPNAHEMSSYAATVFMKAKYKPGVCQGKPCVMQFPFKLALN